MKTKIFFAGLLLVAFMVGSVWPQNPPAPCPPPYGLQAEMKRPLMEKLNLTEEQRKTMQEMRLNHKKELIPIQAKLKEKQLDLKAEMMADEPNQSKINAIVDDLAKLRAEVQKKKIAHRLAIRNILTDEQRKIWDANKHMRKARGFARHEKPHHPCKRPGMHFPPRRPMGSPMEAPRP